MSIIDIKVYLPILPPLCIEGEIFRDWYMEAKREIIDLSHSDYFLLSDPNDEEFGTLDVLIEDIEDESQWPSIGQKILKGKSSRVRTVFCFSAHCELLPNKIQDPTFSDGELMRLRASIIVSGLIQAISDIMTLVHIAKPGCIQVDTGIALLNGELSDTVRGFHSTGIDAVLVAKKVGWPQINVLTIKEVLIWAHKVQGFRDGHAQTRLGRALGALTYLINPDVLDDETMDIMWTMLGLEALYCSSNSELSKQLKEKTEIYLGERTEHKKKLETAYNFRSRFAHGDMDFPLSYSPWDGAEIYERFMSESFEAQSFALATLLATLQKMCREDRYSLDFDYILRDKKKLALI